MKYFLQLTFIIHLFCLISVEGQPVLSLNSVINTGLNTPMQLVHAGDGLEHLTAGLRGMYARIIKSHRWRDDVSTM